MEELKKDFKFKFPSLINISSVMPTANDLREQLSEVDSKIKLDLIENK